MSTMGKYGWWNRISLATQGVAWLAGALLCGLCLAAAAAQTGASKDPAPALVLVGDGKALAPILLPRDPSLFTRLAAEDLAEYIGRIGGAKPAILEGVPEPVPVPAIWVGFQPKLKALFPGTDFDFKHPEEILIKCDGTNLAIVGRDVWDPKIGVIKGGKTQAERGSFLAGFVFGNRDVEGFQFEYGTVNAVYTFLQERLGVRWLWPGKTGEVVPRQANIAIPHFEYRYHPNIRMRHSIFAPLGLYKEGGAPGQAGGDWVRRQRVQLDSLYAPAGGHGFGDWYGHFHKTHPEYFALQSDGTRDYKDNPSNAKICESNPAVWEQWLNDVAEVIARNPHRTVFNAAANDGYGSGHCLCKNCRAWDPPGAERRIWMYPRGTPVEGVALADRQVTFANMLGRKLKERYPGKDYKVLIHAYGYSRPAPIAAVPDDNVLISNVANVFSEPDAVLVESPTGMKAMDAFDAWARITPNQIWRPNTGDPAGWKTGGPPDITGAGTIFKRMAAKGVLGITIDQVWGYWATQGPQYYLMAQLAWDPGREISEIMDGYYRAGFGPAAGDMAAYFTLLEGNRHAIQKQKAPWEKAFSSAFFDKAYALLDRAAEQTAAKEPESRARVAFIRAGLDYLRLNTANQALVKRILQADRPDPALKKEMTANWEQIVKIASEHPNALAGTLARQGPNGNMGYIHPDADHKAIAEKARIKARLVEKRRARATAPLDGGLE